MEPSAMKRYALLALFCVLGGVLNASNESNLTDPEPEYDEPAIIERINKMENEVVPPRYDNIVKSYLTTYTIKKREKAENILGQQVVYFPLFEKKLEEANLPTDLKYLSVVESALNPKAVSRVGATGLWQFMPATGEYYGLEINSVVDERSDPHRSTEAAIEYLSRLYDRFGNWELAIAAYNSGGGRVSRAIKRSRSKNFWKVRSYLPRETRNYVPAFIAANYLIKHYQEHELTPRYPELDQQITESIMVYDHTSFYEVAQVTELPLDMIEALNPAYLQGFIPARQKGYYLTLPKRVMPAFKDYIDQKRPDFEARLRVQSTPVYISKPEAEDHKLYEKSFYTVLEGESLESIAEKIGCTVHQLKAWNHLHTSEIKPGRQLSLYSPKKIKRLECIRKGAIADAATYA
jgi:membrane-bound lytic murein transglycosylase D